jgi:S1-C subfamily serine protease
MNDAPHRPGGRVSRETRLLIATVTVSVLVLLLLSRFRFDEPSSIPAAAPAPLQRLAARATYDELAAIVAGIERNVSPSLVVLRLSPQADTTPRDLIQVLRSAPTDEGVRHVAALRLDETTAIAAILPGTRILGMVGQADDAPPPEIIAADPVRRLALVRVPPVAAAGGRPLTLSDIQPPTYVVVVEGTRAGLTFRPLFVGSGDRFTDPRWERPLLAISGIPLTSPGALVFSLEGQFVGFAVVEAGAFAMAGARDVIAAAQQLGQGTASAPLSAGISVQPLTTPLAAALGARSGVVVAAVEAGGPAADVLETADVIVTIDGRPVDTTDDFLLRLAQHAPGARVTMGLVRGGELSETELILPGRAEGTDRTPAGLSLQFRRGEGSLVTAVASGSPGETAGLEPRDVIVKAGTTHRPSPTEIAALLRDDNPSPYLSLVVDRDGRQRVLAVRRTSDAGR